MPPDPLESLKKVSLAAAWLRIDFPPKQKILDRTLEIFGVEQETIIAT